MKAKVVIIGAGVVGLFSGLRLAERGADVTVIDGDLEDWESRGCAASRAAAGMLAPVSEAQIAHPGAHPRAGELDRASFELWRAAPDFLRPHINFCGALLLSEFGAGIAEAERLDRAEIRRRFGLDAESGALVKDEGVVDPIPALRAMAERIRALGGAVHFDREAETVETRPWLRVRCFGGATFSADRVVLAPGAWASEALAALAPALRHVGPARGCLAPVTMAASLPLNVRARDFYLTQRTTGDIVLGASMELGVAERRVDRSQIDMLFSAAERALPRQVWRSSRPAWAGVRAMSPDWSPLIGPSGLEGVLVACGHSRNGWLNAPITAEIVCAYVFGEEINPLWAAFAPERFETRA
ncbi:MAG TPA: FAD-dependent oxidoreductase [Caulobacterales bacterium]|nr:FAD-dependent oxidoreductase [Caulobacterales bacterium]